MKSAALVFWVLVLVVGSAVYGWHLAWRRSESAGPRVGETEPASNVMEIRPGDSLPTPDIALTERSGREFHTASLKGSVWVVSYFFASCPGPCYRLNQSLAGLQAEPELDDVKFVSITCDPDNDSPDVLKEYANKFNANPHRWFFLTGDLKTVLKLGEERFMLPTEQRAHTDAAVALDRQSRIRGFYHLTDESNVESLRRELRKLLAEPAEAAVPTESAPTKSAAPKKMAPH